MKNKIRNLTKVVSSVSERESVVFVVLDDNGVPTRHSPTKKEIANWYDTQKK